MEDLQTYYFIAGVPHEGKDGGWVKKQDALRMLEEAAAENEELSAEVKRLKVIENQGQLIDNMKQRIQELKKFEGNKPTAVIIEKFMEESLHKPQKNKFANKREQMIADIEKHILSHDEEMRLMMEQKGMPEVDDAFSDMLKQTYNGTGKVNK